MTVPALHPICSGAVDPAVKHEQIELDFPTRITLWQVDWKAAVRVSISRTDRVISPKAGSRRTRNELPLASCLKKGFLNALPMPLLGRARHARGLGNLLPADRINAVSCFRQSIDSAVRQLAHIVK